MYMCKPSMSNLIWLYMDQGLFWMALQFVQVSFLFSNHYRIIDSLSFWSHDDLTIYGCNPYSFCINAEMERRFFLSPVRALLEESSLSYLDLFSGWFIILCSMSMMSSLALTKFFLWKASNLVSLWNWNLYTHVGVQSIFFREIIYFQAWKLSTSPSFSLSWCDISYWNENLKWK